MKEELDKRYEPAAIEQRLYQFWEKGEFFTPDADPERPKFSIVIPPPNVTGRLHIGHALVNTLQDIVVRWKRMSGFNTLWLPGTDHAGIATQMVVERDLNKQGINRHDLGREG
ncbi:MAG: valyl-tRNA synthetase, partial [Acidobacteria bacterium]|nr:valyl-tRNA synthetase [Acidobacteriota bacterium]